MQCSTILVNIPATGKTTLALAFYWKYRCQVDERFILEDFWPPDIDLIFSNLIDLLKKGKLPPMTTQYEKLIFYFRDAMTDESFSISFYLICRRNRQRIWR